LQDSQEGLRQTVCPHHWIIEPADGPLSLGFCKLCGKERWFRNSLPELDRHYDMVREKERPVVLRERELAVY